MSKNKFVVSKTEQAKAWAVIVGTLGLFVTVVAMTILAGLGWGGFHH
jgi:hypothetical protein